MIGPAKSKLLWTACLQFFVVEQVARLGWTLPYSFAKNYISDLGAMGCSTTVCSPWHALMNASFILQGALIAGGAILTWRQWNVLGRVGMALLVVCGIGVMVVGFAPEDGNGALHRTGAAMHFVSGGLGILTVGFSLRNRFGWISMAVGFAVLAATVSLGMLSQAWLEQMGVGTVERVAAYGIAGWMTLAGVFDLRSATQ